MDGLLPTVYVQGAAKGPCQCFLREFRSLLTVLAIYGALLSTLLAWLEYRRDRPFAHIRYDDFARSV